MVVTRGNLSEGRSATEQSARLVFPIQNTARAYLRQSGWLRLPCDKQKERGINRLGVTHTARPTGGLAVHPDRVDISSAVSRVAPGVFGASPQSVGLNPSAPSIDRLYILSKVNLV